MIIDNDTELNSQFGSDDLQQEPPGAGDDLHLHSTSHREVLVLLVRLDCPLLLVRVVVK